jgi:hypothetical protein
VLVKASSVARPAAVGGLAGFLLLALSSNVLAATDAHTAAHSKAAPAACAKRPQAAVLAAAVSSSSTDPSGSVAPDATPTISESTVPSPPKSNAPIASPSPTATATASQAPPPASSPPASSPPASPPPSSTTPKPPPASSPSPTPSPSSSGTSPSPSPSPGKPQLCVQVQSLSGSAKVAPGHTAGFVVWVWSAGGASDAVTVTAKVATAKNIGAPKFTVCPSAKGAICTLGTLPAGQADELQAVSAVEPKATSTEHVTLTATAAGKNALSDGATGSLAVSVTSSSPPASGGGGLPVAIPPVSLQPLPGLPEAPGTVGNPAGLFPTVAPIPSSGSPTIGFPPARKPAARSRAETASSIVPLDPRLIGGQLAGLAVLAGAVAIAIARLSLRRPRPQDGSSDKSGPRDDD